MDVDGPTNQVYEFPVGAPDISDHPNFLVGAEKKIARSGSTNYFYRFRGGKRSYLLVPGANDGIADTYARGDMWLLKYKTGATNLLAEIDDGHNGTTGNTEADLDQFVNGESIDGQDVVVWYHATVTHSPAINSFMCTPTGLGIAGRNILTGDKVVGPDLLPEDF
jgi:Cu2+-containing amine oxidase